MLEKFEKFKIQNCQIIYGGTEIHEGECVGGDLGGSTSGEGEDSPSTGGGGLVEYGLILG